MRADPTHLGPTRRNRWYSFVAWMISVAGIVVLRETLGWRAALGAVLLATGTVLYADAEYARRRQREAAIAVLRRRARAQGINLDEEDDDD